jgi:hypothetical protein
VDGLLGRSPLGRFLLGAAGAGARSVSASSQVTLGAAGSTLVSVWHLVSAASSLAATAASSESSILAAVAASSATFTASAPATTARVHHAAASTGIAVGGYGDAFKVFDIGRLRRGDRAAFFVETVAAPDAAPVAVVLDSGGAVVLAQELPSWKRSRTRFFAPLRIDRRFDLGRYTVTYRYTVGGVPVIAQDVLDVVPGGDSGGEVISLYALDRTKSRFVIAQLGCGRLARGKNPTI